MSSLTNTATVPVPRDTITAPPTQTRWLASGSDQVCVVWHPAVAARARDTAAILCPPFGWEEVCSYRSLRDWAEQLATAGYPTLRMAFPGTGDSSADASRPGLVQAWTDAVGTARDWLADVASGPRIVVIGLGLGGLISCHAAATGIEIDDLVLWSAPTRGRELVRQLRAFSRLQESQLSGEAPAQMPQAPDGLEVSGFRLSDETLRDLSALDLAEAPGHVSASRVLLLERDGLPVDQRLVDHLAGLDVNVTVTSGEGYAAMITPPQWAVTPTKVIATVQAWLDAASAPRPAPRLDATALTPADEPTAIATGTGTWVTETPITIAQPFGNLVGILTQPADAQASALGVVLVNAGAIRRIGPNRMWVEAARRWAQRGVPTLRLDVEGLGDSDGDIEDYRDAMGLYVPKLVNQVLAALDALQQAGVANRFAVGGLCSGATWAFHAAVQHDRVSAAWMVNPRVLILDSRPTPTRDLRALTSEPMTLTRLRKAFSRRGLAVARFLLTAAIRRVTARGPAPPPASKPADKLRERLQELREAEKQAVMLFSYREPLYDAFAETGVLAEIEQAPRFTIERVPVSDHTMRPAWAQQRVHEALDRALDEELQRVPAVLVP